MGQVSNSTRIYALDANARARLNSIFIISLFLGQMMGSSAGSSLYEVHGWTASSSLSLGFLVVAILVLLARGPHAQKWIGWDGGARMRKVREDDKENVGNVEGTELERVDDVAGFGETVQELNQNMTVETAEQVHARVDSEAKLGRPSQEEEWKKVTLHGSRDP
jgi:hypothetical protein